MSLDADSFRRLVSRKIEQRAGVGLDDLPDVNLEDYLDEDGTIPNSIAEETAEEAADEILAEEGFDG